MAEIIDGKAIAKRVRAEVRERALGLAERQGRAPGLHVVLVGEDPASQVYVRNKERAAGKAGIEGKVHRLPEDTAEPALLALIEELNQDVTVDGILVQLPLPGSLDSARVVRAIDPAKDVDGLHPVNAGELMLDGSGLTPCTPTGCMKLIQETGCSLEGRRALVLGRSQLVGKPVAMMLLRQNATVTMAHSRTQDLDARVREADVVIAAVGRPKLVRGEWIKNGAVVIDVGINREPDGTLVGDVDFEAASERASHITPVPGGVGPMTIAMLLDNTVKAAEGRERTR